MFYEVYFVQFYDSLTFLRLTYSTVLWKYFVLEYFRNFQSFHISPAILRS